MHTANITGTMRGLWHPEEHVARKRAGGCYHADLSGGSPGRYGGRDFGSRNDRERTSVSLKLTLVAPVRSLPRILTAAPTSPEVGSVLTNGLRPTDRLKTVPLPAPPANVVP